MATETDCSSLDQSSQYPAWASGTVLFPWMHLFLLFCYAMCPEGEKKKDIFFLCEVEKFDK